MSNRDDFSENTKEKLAQRVGYICSNPLCNSPTIGPSLADESKVQYKGVAAHIFSASKDNGPRPNPSLSPDERKSIRNGIHLCASCSILIDKNNGIDHPAELLFSWKKEAEKNALARIYRAISQNYCRPIFFDIQEIQYSSALGCIGLTEKQINSCPANPRLIEHCITQLNLVHFCIITGPSGIGKSLTAYQVAAKYYEFDFDIFELYIETVSEAIDGIPISKRKILLIVDNAHTLDALTISKIQAKASENLYVIFVWNESAKEITPYTLPQNVITVDPKEQVSIIAEHLLLNAEHVLEKLTSLKVDVGIDVHQISVEQKIHQSAKQPTPWLFNYALTDGWKIAKFDKARLKSNARQDVVLITLAIYQIATLDEGVNKSVIENSLANFNNLTQFILYVEDTLKIYSIKENGKIKLKHYEYAKQILYNVFPENEKEVQKYIANLTSDILLSDEYLKGRSSLIEFINFYLYPLRYEIDRRGVFSSILKEIFTKKGIPDSQSIATLNSINRSDAKYINEFRKNQLKISKWLRLANPENSVEFSRLLNDLYNNKYNREVISKKTILNVQNYLINSDIEAAAKIATLLERLSLYFRNSKSDSLRRSFSSIDFSNLIKQINSKNIYYADIIITSLFSIDKESAKIVLIKILPQIANSFNEDPLEAFLNIHDLVNRAFGMISLVFGKYKEKYYLAEEAKILSSNINPETIADRINKLQYRETQEMGYLLHFIEFYCNDHIIEICENINFQHIANLFRKQNYLSHEHFVFLVSFKDRCEKIENYRNYIESLISKFDIYNFSLLTLSSQACINSLVSNQTKQFTFGESHEYALMIKLLKHLNRIGAYDTEKRIVKHNEIFLHTEINSTISNAEQNLSKLNLFKYILKNHPEAYFNAFAETDQEFFNKKIDRLSTGKSTEIEFSIFYSRLYDQFRK
ncbi:hypothetical protein [Leptospira licerasiae]|uniref:nSTAND3 domain-containing NTPase n=1 Tax=Leptospira licerasiae TaxID=447106 RepID=UPI00301AFC14